jgi:hypothetical protein
MDASRPSPTTCESSSRLGNPLHHWQPSPGFERRAEAALICGKVAIMLFFENGLVISIGQDASKVDFYRSNRIDFRHFHRGVSDQQSVSFELTSLQDTEE